MIPNFSRAVNPMYEVAHDGVACDRTTANTFWGKIYMGHVQTSYVNFVVFEGGKIERGNQRV